jgi:hypothetical protein
MTVSAMTLAATIDAPPRRLANAVRMARLRTAGVLAGLLGVGAVVNPIRPLPFDTCVLKSITGWPCPTCGLTRAVCSALHGDIAGSLAFHPAGLIVLASLVGWLVWSVLEAWQGRPLWDTARSRAGRAAGYLTAAVSIVFWIVELS